MPTSTYFRLPEEKRQRLTAACWAELTEYRFSEVSINRIIAAARIPRGSFYQYFTDKEDLIRYLMEDMREYFVSLIRAILVENGGDLTAFPLAAFDHFVQQRGDTDPMLAQFIRILKLNQGFDPQSFMTDAPGFLPDPLWEVVDPAKLRQPDRPFADHVFHLACAVLAFAVVGVLQGPANWAEQRESLKTRMELLRHGCAAPDKEETT